MAGTSVDINSRAFSAFSEFTDLAASTASMLRLRLARLSLTICSFFIAIL